MVYIFHHNYLHLAKPYLSLYSVKPSLTRAAVAITIAIAILLTVSS
jgi:hypothetical protein